MNFRNALGFSKKNIILSIVLFSLALGTHIFRTQMSKLDEDIVYAYYQKSINATRMFDVKTLCDSYDAKYRAIDISKGPGGEMRLDLNRQQACDQTRESMVMMKKVVAASRLEPEFKYTIESVSLSPDRKQATVKIRALMRVGKRLSVTSSGTETLVRRMGTVRSLGSETKSVVSVR